ncbi:MAG: ATP-binding protein, partial [Proteobacteria bacterium]|nr:ATP-binding protein [Pseudomonadota bacterium]
MDHEILWRAARDVLKNRLTETDFKVWIDPLAPLGCQGRTLVLGCPNRFFMGWVREKYLAHLVDALVSVPFEDNDLSAVDLKVAPLGPPVRNENGATQVQFELPAIEVHRRSPLLFNRRFTFDRFVVGSPNQFAYSAALAMASGQDLNADCLYLLAGPGLGKSHLSQAMGQHFLIRHPQRRVYYMTAEDFTNEMVYSIKNKCTEDFKDKYRRNCDVLVLEEVQFLSGKEKVQSELSYTLDCLVGNGRKVVFTASRLPRDIPRIGRPLASRLCSGLISTIEPPDYETRLRILQRKAKENGLSVKAEVLDC